MKLNSLIVSHVETEVPPSSSTTDNSFIPLPIRKDPTNETVFNNFIANFLKGNKYSDLWGQIESYYNSSRYADQVERAAHVISDSSFLCNTRNLLDVYAGSGQAFAMDYSFLGDYNVAVHASDLIPTFAPQNGSYADLIKCLKPDIFPILPTIISNYIIEQLGPGIQSYFMSLALGGDPNKFALGPAAKYIWSPASVEACSGDASATCVQGVMKPTFAFPYNPFEQNAYEDIQTNSTVCGFWSGIAKSVMELYPKFFERPQHFLAEEELEQNVDEL